MKPLRSHNHAMELTTKNIIKILPFRDEFKKSLLERFDSLTDDQRLQIERVVWDFYDALYELKLQENIALALQKSGEEQVKLTKDFYRTIEEQTEQEMFKSTVSIATKVDLEQARDQLEEIIDEHKPQTN